MVHLNLFKKMLNLKIKALIYILKIKILVKSSYGISSLNKREISHPQKSQTSKPKI